MKLNIKGDINAFYVQTLCLLFYPGSKFSKKDSCEDGMTVDVEILETEIEYSACVGIHDGNREYKGGFSLSKSEQLSRPSMAKKITVGKAFLEAGEKATGIVPPWGILTGVRPSKLALWELEKGRTVQETVNTFSREYSVSNVKARLACEVAKNEKNFLRPELYGKSSVYIAVPFCPTRCSYCSFVSYTSDRLLSLIPEYLDVLVSEIKKTSELVNGLGQKVSTVYIGGGTPTVLNDRQLEKLLSSISENFDVGELDEFTLEAGRPDTINSAKLLSAKNHGITRVSVNTQTLNNSILESIGRRHNADDFYRAYDAARRSGIKDINVDLIAALPGESFESFAASVDKVAALEPENVTVHTFCVKKSADLRSHGVYDAKCDLAGRSVAYSQDLLMSRNYSPYYMYRQKNAVGNLENVGYAFPGHEGIYNILMMEEVQSIFAVGASAVTKIVGRDKDGKTVIKRFAENKYPYEYLREKTGADSELLRSEYEKQIADLFSDFS